MAFTPQNYVDQVGPAVSAAWLNGVDYLENSVFAGAQTVPNAVLALSVLSVNTVLPQPTLTSIGNAGPVWTGAQLGTAASPTNNTNPVFSVAKYYTGVGAVAPS